MAPARPRLRMGLRLRLPSTCCLGEHFDLATRLGLRLGLRMRLRLGLGAQHFDVLAAQRSRSPQHVLYNQRQ